MSDPSITADMKVVQTIRNNGGYMWSFCASRELSNDVFCFLSTLVIQNAPELLAPTMHKLNSPQGKKCSDTGRTDAEEPWNETGEEGKHRVRQPRQFLLLRNSNLLKFRVLQLQTNCVWGESQDDLGTLEFCITYRNMLLLLACLLETTQGKQKKISKHACHIKDNCPHLLVFGELWGIFGFGLKHHLNKRNRKVLLICFNNWEEN